MAIRVTISHKQTAQVSVLELNARGIDIVHRTVLSTLLYNTDLRDEPPRKV